MLGGPARSAVKSFLIAYWESRGAIPTRVRFSGEGAVTYFEEPIEVMPGVHVRKMYKSFKAIEALQGVTI